VGGAWIEGRGKRFLGHGPDAARPSGAVGLIEVELGDRLGIGRVEGGRLVEVVGWERFHRSDGVGVERGCGLGGARAGETRGAV
jgi:hypothetical protein